MLQLLEYAENPLKSKRQITRINTMKNFTRFATIILASLITFGSCTQKDEPIQPKERLTNINSSRTSCSLSIPGGSAGSYVNFANINQNECLQDYWDCLYGPTTIEFCENGPVVKNTIGPIRLTKSYQFYSPGSSYFNNMFFQIAFEDAEDLFNNYKNSTFCDGGYTMNWTARFVNVDDSANNDWGIDFYIDYECCPR